MAAIALSLLVNLLVLTQVDVGWLAKAPATAPRRDVTLAPLSASEWAANRAVRGESSRPAAPAAAASPSPSAPPRPPPRDVPGQVVDVAPSKDSTPPKDSRFVSDRDNTVEKETRSRHARAGYENTLAKPSSPKAPVPSARPAPAPREAERQSAGAAGTATTPGKPGRPGPAHPTMPSDVPRQRLALVPGGELKNPLPVLPVMPRGGDGGDGGHGSAGAAAAGNGAASKGSPTRPDLRPSASDYDRIAGGPAPDHLEGIEEGEGTYLNTREWKYAGYFNRIKQAVAAIWDPGASLSSRDPTGARFGDRDWQTLLAVKLDSNGSLKTVSVARSSGLDFLDRTAVDAFHKAQPFTNPPSGLADEQGEIAFTFGFYVQTSGAGFRIFRNAH